MNKSVEKFPDLPTKNLIANVKARAEAYKTQALTSNQDMQMLIWADETSALVDAILRLHEDLIDLKEETSSVYRTPKQKKK